MLSEVEKIILENLEPKFKYIARDRNGFLWIYSHCPKRVEEYGFWEIVSFSTSSKNFSFYQHLFKSIKWEDEKPYKFR